MTMDFVVHYGTHDGAPYFNVSNPVFQPLRNPRIFPRVALGIDDDAGDLVRAANAGKYPHYSPASPNGPPAEIWSASQLSAASKEVPQYNVQGPQKRALCSEAGVAAKSLLIRSDQNVHTLKEAAARCDSTPGCTHFSWTAESKFKLPYEPIEGSPWRVDLCRGPVRIKDSHNMNTIVGIRRTTPGATAGPGPLEPEEYNGPVPDLRTMPRTKVALLPAALLPLMRPPHERCGFDDASLEEQSTPGAAHGRRRNSKWRSFL
eukprot:TRINITY_DN66257_c0_g1_i1.p1 TRINITY_DN66257_c0_g1~~TRINITY_DN66257_c0_g1_i1.p1  ORF type:complete len:261 (+),score=20.37 TRINITY_DN66257_c0_g1_i1:197-979(+)